MAYLTFHLSSKCYLIRNQPFLNYSGRLEASFLVLNLDAQFQALQGIILLKLVVKIICMPPPLQVFS